MKNGYKECPFCANEIKEGATKCQFCKTQLNGECSSITEKEKIKSIKPLTVLIVTLCIIISVLSFLLIKEKISKNDVSYVKNSNIDNFEKKKKCVEMRKVYEDYVKQTRNIEKDKDGYYQTVGDVDIFYNSERDSCLGAFYTYSNMYSTNKEHSTRYAIYDYMNGNEEVFSCSNLSNYNCMNEWEAKKIELGK